MNKPDGIWEWNITGRGNRRCKMPEVRSEQGVEAEEDWRGAK